MLLVLSVLCVCVLIEVIVIVIVLSIRLQLEVLDKEIDLIDHVAAHTDSDHSLRIITLGVCGSGELVSDLKVETLCLLTALSSIEALILLADSREVNIFKNGNKNLLTPDNLDTIFNEYHEREDVQYKAKLVSNKDILANDCNLSVSSYVEQEDKREKINIVELNSDIDRIVEEGIVLRKRINEIINNIK